jgi:hypothetical protein
VHYTRVRTIACAGLGVLSLLLGGWSSPRALGPPDGPSSDYAVTLNGADSYVRAPDTPSLRIEEDNAFTVTAWVNFDRFDNNVLPRIWEKGPHYVCVMGNRSNRRFGTIGLEVQNSSFSGNAHGGAAEFWGNTRIKPRQWYFIAVTFDGNEPANQARIYINGAQERMSIVFPWHGRLQSTAGTDWFLGRRHTDEARNLQGRVGRVTVYQRALSAAEIETVYAGGLAADASAAWSFRNVKAGRVTDDAGNGNIATLVNATVTSRAPGKRPAPQPG